MPTDASPPRDPHVLAVSVRPDPYPPPADAVNGQPGAPPPDTSRAAQYERDAALQAVVVAPEGRSESYFVRTRFIISPKKFAEHSKALGRPPWPPKVKAPGP